MEAAHEMDVLRAVSRPVDQAAVAPRESRHAQRAEWEQIVRDLARALDAEAGVVAIATPPHPRGGNVTRLAEWGAATARGSRALFRLEDCFLGRALRLEHAEIQPLDPDDPGYGTSGLPPRGSQVACAPLRDLHGSHGVLCVVLPADPPADRSRTLWHLERYAHLAELCLQDPRALEALLSAGHVDELTGCLTQIGILRELRREIARAGRHELPLSCVFADVDGFKRINDHFGHLYGSRLIADIAGALRNGVRDGDSVGRYGGDEFVLLLPNTGEAAAIELVARLRSTIGTTLPGLPHEPLDASFGVAQWQRGATVEALVGAADQALLDAKTAGGGRVVAAGVPVRPRPPNAQSRALPSPPPDRTARASLADVLAVLVEFDQWGGASVELTAWVLGASHARISAFWSRAAADQLIVPNRTDRRPREQLWQLTDRGRQLV